MRRFPKGYGGARRDPEQIKRELTGALRPLEDFSECALLDYPDYFNIGDHLIWLGACVWLPNACPKLP